jgi:hypothetical protein
MTPAKRATAAVPEHVDLDLDEVASEGYAEPAMTFKLDGRVWHVKNVDDLPWATLDNWVKGTLAQIGGDGTQSALTARDFFTAVLVDSEQEAFGKVLDQPKTAPTVRTIRALSTKVQEVLFDLPTTPSSTSSAGRQATGTRSTASSRSTASQPRAS